MTDDQIYEAIGKMMDECDKAMPTYTMLSARRALERAGYRDEATQIQPVLLHIAEGGFDYCLDHTILMTGHHEDRHKAPSRDVCYWGPDQLFSRLSCLTNIPTNLRHRRLVKEPA